MKKRFFVLPVFAAFAYITLSSDSNGPGGNKTGSHGVVAGCGSCHGSSATSGVTLSFVLDSAGTTVTSYKPGMTYTLKMTGVNTTSNTLPKFGTQMSVVSGSGSSSINAGQFQAWPAGTDTFRTGGICILEHNTPLSPVSGTGASGTTYEVSTTWKAPAAGTGTVTVYGVINAVNNNSSDGTTDKWNNASASFTELPGATTAVTDTPVAHVNVFPNPVADQLNITNYRGNYIICSMGGTIMASGTCSGSAVISTSSWSAGTYVVRLGERMKRVIVKK